MRAERKKWLEDKEARSNSDKTARLLVPLLVSMAFCSFLFVGATFAWFSDTNYYSLPPSASGKWAVDFKIIDSENNEIVVVKEGCTFNATLEANKIYTVIIIPQEGNDSQGVCYVTFDGATYYTCPILRDEYSFTIGNMNKTENSEFRAVTKWGSASAESSWQILENNAVIGDISQTAPDEQTTNAPPVNTTSEPPVIDNQLVEVTQDLKEESTTQKETIEDKKSSALGETTTVIQ